MKILFVAANPLDTGRLALDEEMRAIERKIAGSPFAARMSFAATWAARPDDLLQAINEHVPTVIHFAGHASVSALELVSDTGRAQPVPNEAILRLMSLESTASVRAVVLSACYTSELASEIGRRVGCAIGMTGRWGDTQAPLFSAAFYRAIAFGATIREAVEQGCTSLLLEGLHGTDGIRLHCDEQHAQIRLLGGQALESGRRSPLRASAIPLLGKSEGADYAAELLARTGRSGLASLTYIDVDGLLGINAVYGEHVGDLVIDKCSEIVASHTAKLARYKDEIVGACRLRGDQFIIVNATNCHHVYQHLWAANCSRLLLEEIKMHDWTFLARDLHVSVTGAVAHWDRSEDSASLILRAILAVKQAKRTQKGELAYACVAPLEFDGRPMISDRDMHILRMNMELS